ncbi:MAG: 1-(5-phosphoribosyl)-5-amino-4-imidazole-carboxylate carboxylase [delta proteobacterium MLS_D]|nr:MAG: 1-(5-phosphoribosyl)-5-amino-4-imidazole-carboxylate carboxylase [delta proteobacterium MLS_D]
MTERGKPVKDDLEEILRDVRNGTLDIGDAVGRIRERDYKDLGFAKIDNQRPARLGRPEVVFCEGKTVTQVREIVRYMLTRDTNVLATRATVEMYEAVAALCGDAGFNETARTITIRRGRQDRVDTRIAVVTAGTSDLPVAEEAAVTAEMLGNPVDRVVDVGVAGIHRLFGALGIIRRARVIIVVAGMEGALPSVLGGLVDKPVIAVPTSVGYGASFGGLAALLGMLNSCAGGVAVVNIDNGYGAACVASAINHLT